MHGIKNIVNLIGACASYLPMRFFVVLLKWVKIHAMERVRIYIYIYTFHQWQLYGDSVSILYISYYVGIMFRSHVWIQTGCLLKGWLIEYVRGPPNEKSTWGFLAHTFSYWPFPFQNDVSTSSVTSTKGVHYPIRTVPVRLVPRHGSDCLWSPCPSILCSPTASSAVFSVFAN